MSQPDFLYELFEDFMDDPANQEDVYKRQHLYNIMNFIYKEHSKNQKCNNPHPHC